MYRGKSAGIVIIVQLRKLHRDIGSAPGWNARIAMIAAVSAYPGHPEARGIETLFPADPEFAETELMFRTSLLSSSRRTNSEAL